MNCRTYQYWILQENSGELGRWKTRLLASHCRHCQTCAPFRAFVPDLEAKARLALDIGDAGRSAAAMAVRRAWSGAPRFRRRFALDLGPVLGYRPVAAFAAVLLLLAGTAVYQGWKIAGSGAIQTAQPTPGGTAWAIFDPVFLQQEADLIEEVLSAWEAEARHVFAREWAADFGDELDELALELLRLEDSTS